MECYKEKFSMFKVSSEVMVVPSGLQEVQMGSVSKGATKTAPFIGIATER